jgi:hypothetical protein
MKKILFSFIVAMSIFSVAFSQEKKLKVVWDVSDSDTATTAGVFRQVNNALTLVPDLEIEVVFHGPAIYNMVKDSTVFASRIVIAKQKGVQLSVCNNSMKRLKVDASQLVQEAGVVPSAVVELIKRQAEGWSYLKAGH